jgi:hypothetical protein
VARSGQPDLTEGSVPRGENRRAQIRRTTGVPRGEGRRARSDGGTACHVARVGEPDPTDNSVPRGENRRARSDGQKRATWRGSESQIRRTTVCHVARIGQPDLTEGSVLRGEDRTAKSDGRQLATWRGSDSQIRRSSVCHVARIGQPDPTEFSLSRGDRTVRSDDDRVLRGKDRKDRRLPRGEDRKARSEYGRKSDTTWRGSDVRLRQPTTLRVASIVGLCVAVLLSLCCSGSDKIVNNLLRLPSLMPSLYNLLTSGTPRAKRNARFLLRVLHSWEPYSHRSNSKTPHNRCIQLLFNTHTTTQC